MPVEKRCPVKLWLNTVFNPWPSAHNVLIILAVVFLLSLVKLSASEWASWVQAAGSIAAIVAAAFIPIWHGRVSSRAREKQLAGTMRVLALAAQEKLWVLSNSFLKVDQELKEMQQYLNSQRQKEWGGLLSSVAQIPIAELPATRVMDLGILRDAVLFGEHVTSILPRWIEEGTSHPDVVIALRAKRDLLDIVISRMPNPIGLALSVPDWVRASQRFEERRPDPNPLYVEGVRVCRRFSWASDASAVPNGFQLHYFFPDGRYERSELTSYPWKTVDDLNQAISSEVNDVIAKYNGDF
ncbi:MULTISPECIES: hypothetical protein [Pseudomonas]|uniref:hypothetical protein n=1 Tax=Pseudomonas TaxID=286 RepID=UPI0018E7A363|nr:MULTISPECIES: hypothetical protein [Pseudomonas]MBJ2345533.1 hypothetical protein [Pseudomonas canavaninivorans]MBL3544703.1 hypothetical protein [Pseudomonas sp. HB05]